MAQDPNLFTFPSTQEQLDQFLAAYTADKLMFPPDKAMRGFKTRNLRVCRFCNSPAGSRKFKKAAHVIPECLGNKHLQSDFECDDCNALFGKYETDFAAWLGIARSVNGTVGKNGVPTFKSPNEMITARLTEFYTTNATKISTPSPDTGAINFDRESGKTVITYMKEPYTPIKVYKCLLKMALSMIATDEVEQYRPALKYLISGQPLPWFDEFAKIMIHVLPMEHRYSKPVGFLYKKTDAAAKLPMHVFVFYYETYIFALPLPFNELDWNAGLYKDLDILYPPAIVFHQPHPQSRCISRNLDLSGYEKVVGQEGHLSFEMKPEDLKNMMSFDPKTGESKEAVIDPGEIVAVVFATAGTTIKFDDITGKPA